MSFSLSKSYFLVMGSSSSDGSYTCQTYFSCEDPIMCTIFHRTEEGQYTWFYTYISATVSEMVLMKEQQCDTVMRVYDRRNGASYRSCIFYWVQSCNSNVLFEKVGQPVKLPIGFLLVHLANEAVTFCQTDSLKVFCQVYVADFPSPGLHCENVLALARIGDESNDTSL